MSSYIMFKSINKVNKKMLIRYANMHASKKLPIKTINIFCSICKEKLFKYKKGGKGALVKCIEERIVNDYTNKDLKCPNCSTEFGRPFRMGSRNAIKFIGNRVYHKK